MAAPYMALPTAQQMAYYMKAFDRPFDSRGGLLQYDGSGYHSHNAFIQQHLPNGSPNYPMHNPFADLSLSGRNAHGTMHQPARLAARQNLLQAQKADQEKPSRPRRTNTVSKGGSVRAPPSASVGSVNSLKEPRSLLTSPLSGEDLMRSPAQLNPSSHSFSEPTKTSHVRRRSRRIAEAAWAKNDTAPNPGRRGHLAVAHGVQELSSVSEHGAMGLGVLEWDGIVHKVDADLGLDGSLIYDYDSAHSFPLASPSTTIKSGLTYSPPTSAPASPYLRDWSEEIQEEAALGTMESFSPDIMAMLTPELIGFLSPDFTGVPFDGSSNVYTCRKSPLGVSSCIDPCRLAEETHASANSAVFLDALLAELSASPTPSCSVSESSAHSSPERDVYPSPSVMASHSIMMPNAGSNPVVHKRKRSISDEDQDTSNKRTRRIKTPRAFQDSTHSVPSREPSLESLPDENTQQATGSPDSQHGQPKQDITCFYTAVPWDRSCTGGGKPLRRYECLFDGCHRIFPRRTAVTAHIMTHLEDKPFICPDAKCGAAFVRQHDLRRHERIHNSVKSFTCPCGKGFSRGDALMRHRCRGICQGSISSTRYPQAQQLQPRQHHHHQQQQHQHHHQLQQQQQQSMFAFG